MASAGHNDLTHPGQVTYIYICVSKLSHYSFRWWLDACQVPIHYKNQCWLIVSWTFRNKLDEIWIIFFKSKTNLKISSALMPAILSWTQFVMDILPIFFLCNWLVMIINFWRIIYFRIGLSILWGKKDNWLNNSVFFVVVVLFCFRFQYKIPTLKIKDLLHNSLLHMSVT